MELPLEWIGQQDWTECKSCCILAFNWIVTIQYSWRLWPLKVSAANKLLSLHCRQTLLRSHERNGGWGHIVWWQHTAGYVLTYLMLITHLLRPLTNQFCRFFRPKYRLNCLVVKAFLDARQLMNGSSCPMLLLLLMAPPFFPSKWQKDKEEGGGGEVWACLNFTAWFCQANWNRCHVGNDWSRSKFKVRVKRVVGWTTYFSVQAVDVPYPTAIQTISLLDFGYRPGRSLSKMTKLSIFVINPQTLKPMDTKFGIILLCSAVFTCP